MTERNVGTPWRVVGRETVFAADPFVRVIRESVRLPDGRIIDDYYRVDLGDFACVYPRTSDGKTIILRQYRHGPGGTTLSFPGGHRRNGESSHDCARRELLEETGYAAPSLRHLTDVIIDGNKHCGVASLFLAEDCFRKREPDNPDIEEAELLLLSEEELHAAARSGEFRIATHLLLLAMASHPRMLDPAPDRCLRYC